MPTTEDIAIFEQPPKRPYVTVAAIDAYDEDYDAALADLIKQAKQLGGDAILMRGDIVGPGCGSPDGPADYVIQGYSADVIRFE